MKYKYSSSIFSVLMLISCSDQKTESEKKSESDKKSAETEAEAENPVIEVEYRLHKPCFFSIKLPPQFILSAMYNDTSQDYCDYEVKSEGSPFRFMINSLTKKRFKETDIVKLFAAAQEPYGESIFQKSQMDNWFVIYANDTQEGKIICWKRVVGEKFISDLKITYDVSEKSKIEPYLEEILNSFESD